MAFLMAMSAMAILVVRMGGGMHTYDMQGPVAETILYWVNVAQIVYSMGMLCTKLALLTLFLGLFGLRRRGRPWWMIVVVMLLNTGFYTALMFTKIFQCIPREAIWNKSIASEAHCISLIAILDVSGIWNAASDIVILLLPLSFVASLRLTLNQKLGVCAIFAVGIM